MDYILQASAELAIPPANLTSNTPCRLASYGL